MSVPGILGRTRPSSSLKHRHVAQLHVLLSCPVLQGLSDLDVATFCQKCVEPMGEESDHVHLVALTDALQVRGGGGGRGMATHARQPMSMPWPVPALCNLGLLELGLLSIPECITSCNTPGAGSSRVPRPQPGARRRCRRRWQWRGAARELSWYGCGTGWHRSLSKLV